MSELKPTMENMHDPYVIQLIESLAKRDDEIASLAERLVELERTIEHLEATIRFKDIAKEAAK